MNSFHTLLIGILMLLFTACSTSKKAVSGSIPSEESLPPLPLTEIDIPIKIYAAPILARAEAVVSQEFTSESWPNYIQPSCDFRYKYRFVRSGMAISCVNNKIGVQFTGNYQVAGSRCICSLNQPVTPWISGSCGFGSEPMRKVSINLNSQIQFLPNFQVHTATNLTQLMAYDKCHVSMLSNDVTQLILDSVKSSVNSFCATLDATIAEFSFSGILQQVQDKSFHKQAVGKYGFVLINPNSFRVGQLNYSKDSFSISAGISCRPEMSSDSTNDSNPHPLPKLIQGENRNGVLLYINGAFDYAFLSKLLQDTLYNKVFEVKGRTVVVKTASIRGIGNRQVEIKIGFAGANKGSIALRGTPVLDTAKQTLSLPDLSYSLESQDLALKVARSLFKNKIRKSIQGKSYLDIAALVKSNLPEMNLRLQQQFADNITTSGRALDARLIGLLARPDKLLVQVYFKGEITASINKL
jgi:hypothetical protein